MQCLQEELKQTEARVVELQRDATPTRKYGKTFAYWVIDTSHYLQDQGMAEEKTSETLRKVYKALTDKGTSRRAAILQETTSFWSRNEDACTAAS